MDKKILNLLLLFVILSFASCTKREACEASMNFSLLISFFMCLYLAIPTIITKAMDRDNEMGRIIMYILLFTAFLSLIGWGIFIIVSAIECFDSGYGGMSLISIFSFIPPTFLLTKSFKNLQNSTPKKNKTEDGYNDILDDIYTKNK